MSTVEQQPAPVTLNALSNVKGGAWLRSWSNGADLLVKDVRTGRWIPNPRHLSANVHRTEIGKGWTIRFFLMGQAGPVHLVEDVWTLRMVRQLLACLAADWAPLGTDEWFLRDQLREAVRQAWLKAADAEIAKIDGDRS